MGSSPYRGLVRGSFPAPHHHDPNKMLPNFCILGHGGLLGSQTMKTIPNVDEFPGNVTEVKSLAHWMLVESMTRLSRVPRSVTATSAKFCMPTSWYHLLLLLVASCAGYGCT